MSCGFTSLGLLGHSPGPCFLLRSGVGGSGTKFPPAGGGTSCCSGAGGTSDEVSSSPIAAEVSVNFFTESFLSFSTHGLGTTVA